MKSQEQVARRAQLNEAIARQIDYVTQDAIEVAVKTKRLEMTTQGLHQLQAELAQLDEIEGRDP